MTPWCTHLVKVKVTQRQGSNWHFWPYFNIYCSYDPLERKFGQGNPRSPKIKGKHDSFDHISTYIVYMTPWCANLVNVTVKVIQCHPRSKVKMTFLTIFQHISFIWPPWYTKLVKFEVKVRSPKLNGKNDILNHISTYIVHMTLWCVYLVQVKVILGKRSNSHIRPYFNNNMNPGG